MGKQRGKKTQNKQETALQTDEKNSALEVAKEDKLFTLLAEIIIKSTLKEFYETCDQVSSV